MSGKKQPRYDVEQIRTLFLAGLSDKDIAKKLGRNAPNAWRTVQRIRLENKWERPTGAPPEQSADTSQIERSAVTAQDLSDMSSEERITYLQQSLSSSHRFAYMFNTLDPDEVNIFQEEYFKVLRDVDDISMTEEQSLFLAIYELVLALRAQKNRKDEEELVRRSRNGEIDGDDPLFTTHVSERHEREYNAHMKQYQSLIDNLKLSRRQRLDKQIQGKKSFLDFAHELSDDDAQRSVAEEIRKLNKLDDAELTRLIEKGFLLGYFERSTN